MNAKDDDLSTALAGFLSCDHQICLIYYRLLTAGDLHVKNVRHEICKSFYKQSIHYAFI